MSPKTLLFVDDDRIARRMIEKKWAPYADRFALVLAENGVEAVRLLQSQPISIVVTDLQMPEMDGFQLLAHLSEHYPDIPVIIQTAYDNPKFRRAVLEGGAVGYVGKPLDVEALSEEVTEALQETTEGGTLQTVPLETFCQLIQMEGKTCTLRIGNRGDGRQAALFFNAGKLVDARIGEMRGRQAAMEILSWQRTMYAIQESCQVEAEDIDLDSVISGDF